MPMSVRSVASRPTPTAPDIRRAESQSEHLGVQPDAEWRAPRPGGIILPVFVTLAALAVFGGIAGYTYDLGESQFEAPGILADSGPIKSQPESADRLNAPNQDVAGLNDGAPDPANPQVERLLPPPQTESVEAEAITEPEALALAGPPLETAPGPAEKLSPEAESPLASAPQIAAAPEPPPALAAPAAAPLPEPLAAPFA